MTVHLVVGPDQHGVVQHGLRIARACGDRVLRVRPGQPWPDPDGAELVHLPFTDRLFAPGLDAAAAAFHSLAAHLAARGAALSVTLHDVPHDDSPLQVRRRALYREVIGAARGVVVNSRLELSLVEDLAGTVHSLRLAPLPVLPAPGAGVGAARTADIEVAVLGFVYPDRGYEDVLAALPPYTTLLALGRPSDGHGELAERYARMAGGRWSMTGYLPDDELSRRLLGAAVPIAPNRRITASGSLNTWIAHGRRPLVPDSPYTREIVADRPGTVTVYDPTEPGALRAAVDAALEHPESTWLPDGLDRGPTLDAVAGIYREHLAACAPPSPVAVAGGWTVPGNRWDLLAGHGTGPARVSVVIPYYEAQHQLDRTLAALAAQTHPAERLEIVVADDGSAVPPDVTGAGGLTVRVVRQEDLGFRAAAARNLGVAAARGDVLVFLDADTVPDPDYVARLTRLPALCPDALTVGRRLHADFGGDPPAVLDPLYEPLWLRSAYEASGDLLDADARSYRFVISAVLAMSRRLFDELGGFDERFVGYGGEDWELAHRAWVAGAVFAHVPDAVARHDGPDWAGRPGASRPDAKNDETMRLAALLPDPGARGGGQWQPYCSVVVRAGSRRADELLLVARSAFASGADVGIWADAVTGPHWQAVLGDPRVHLGEPPADVVARARVTVRLTAPGAPDLSGLPALIEAAERHGTVRAPALCAESSRARNRARRWWPEDADACSDRLFGRHDRSGPPVASGPVDLAAGLRRC